MKRIERIEQIVFHCLASSAATQLDETKKRTKTMFMT